MKLNDRANIFVRTTQAVLIIATSTFVLVSKVNAGSSETSETVTVDTRGPEIVVMQPPGSNIVSGKGKKTFGTVQIGGRSIKKSFTIINNGATKLTQLIISKTGDHSKDFAVSKPTNIPLGPGKSCSFEVTFKPTGTGIRNCTLQIDSNDPDEAPFNIKTGGMGVRR